MQFRYVKKDMHKIIELMVAGFVAGSVQGDYEYALKLGTAAGGATAFSEGLAQKDDICRLLEQLQTV